MHVFDGDRHILELLEQISHDFFDGLRPHHFIDRVFELGICGIKFLHLPDLIAGHFMKKSSHPSKVAFVIGMHHSQI